MKYHGMNRQTVVEFFIEKDGENCYYCHQSLGIRFVIEHNHITDEIRGLAHYSCNSKIAREDRINGIRDTTKTINVVFEDEEIEKLERKKGEKSWHDFICTLIKQDQEKAIK